jgi:hypothetical protein
MQKDWITIGTAACCGIAARWLVAQRVGSPLRFVQRIPVEGAGLGACSGSLGSFRLCMQGTSTTG